MCFKYKTIQPVIVMSKLNTSICTNSHIKQLNPMNGKIVCIIALVYIHIIKKTKGYTNCGQVYQ